MLTHGQQPLSEIDFFPAPFRGRLRSHWIETVEEFFALVPLPSEVDAGFQQEWEEAEDALVRKADEKTLEYLRKFSRSSDDERPLGVAVSGANSRNVGQIAPMALCQSLPTAFCLADEFPERFGPISNQKESGECVACTVTALVEFVKRRKEPLSSRFLHQESKNHDGHLCSRGADLATSIGIASAVGICPECCFSIGDENFQEPDVNQCHTEAARYRMANSRTVLLGNTDHFKAVLTGGGDAQPMPIAVTLLVFDSWYQSLSTVRTGKWTLPLPGETPKSFSHAVLMIGYQDDTSVPGGGYFIARNSWGESWATDSPREMNGHALIPYSYVQQFACDAFTGPEILLGLREAARDCNGRKYPAGTAILVNSDYPEDFMEDTQANRKKFQEYNSVWKEENRYDIVKRAIDTMYRQGRGELGQASIGIKHVVRETGFASEEVERLFRSLERREQYSTYQTINGDLAIRRPGK